MDHYFTSTIDQKEEKMDLNDDVFYRNYKGYLMNLAK